MIVCDLTTVKYCIYYNYPCSTCNRQMQEVLLDKHVRLLDSPGIVMASSSQGDMAILRNCVKVETLDDPLKPVEVILKRCNKQKVGF